MTEDLLHFVWRTQAFDFRTLQTTDGCVVEILDFGHLNDHAGPDFLAARIKIDGIHWVGNVEMHLSASDWNRHLHSQDPAYESVILHIVLEEDVAIYIGSRRLACIELKDRIPGALLGRYLRLMANESWVPCAAQLSGVPNLTRDLWLDRMLIERIQAKLTVMNRLLDETHDNWEGALYLNLASAYGFKVNSEPFLRVARRLPLKCLYKHQDSLLQTEAMLFGCAGMLNCIFMDAYPTRLQKEFAFLDTKYTLGAINARAWNWGRVRPANFPTVRIAQFAALMTGFQGLFRHILETPKVETLRTLFTVPISVYWHTHSAFDRVAQSGSRDIGVASVDGILINTVVPFLFCYGKRRGEDVFIERALELVTHLPSENNKIARQWKLLGMPNLHAGQSQALIHLKRHYCDQRKCTSCAIGNDLLTSMNNS